MLCEHIVPIAFALTISIMPFSNTDRSSMASNGRKSSSPRSSVSVPQADHNDGDNSEVVSKSMREEEKKMKLASAKEEEDRLKQAQEGLSGKNGLDVAAVDERFVKLDRLLSQSKVGYQNITRFSYQYRI